MAIDTLGTCQFALVITKWKETDLAVSFRRQHPQSYDSRDQEDERSLHRHLRHVALLRSVELFRRRSDADSLFSNLGTMLQAHVSAAKAAIDALFRVAAGQSLPSTRSLDEILILHF